MPEAESSPASVGTTPATVARPAAGGWAIAIPEDGAAGLLSYPTKGRMVLTERGEYVVSTHLTVAMPWNRSGLR
jgi:hypothetical protein